MDRIIDGMGFGMTVRKRLLFVCTIHKMRSVTAQKIYEEDIRFDVKSAGIDSTADIVISDFLLNWADCIIVMEKRHRNFIRQKFPDIYRNKKIVCLYIDDDYEYMQAGLIKLLKERVEDLYLRKLL